MARHLPELYGMSSNTQLNDSGIHGIRRIPAAANLEHWSDAEWTNGIQIDRMPDMESVIVETENSTYEITVIEGRSGEVVVRGGQFFPQMTAAHLSGATLRGSFLKLRGIYVGFNMEFLHEGRCIVTSSVRKISARI